MCIYEPTKDIMSNMPQQKQMDKTRVYRNSKEEKAFFNVSVSSFAKISPKGACKPEEKIPATIANDENTIKYTENTLASLKLAAMDTIIIGERLIIICDN